MFTNFASIMNSFMTQQQQGSWCLGGAFQCVVCCGGRRANGFLFVDFDFGGFCLLSFVEFICVKLIELLKGGLFVVFSIFTKKIYSVYRPLSSQLLKR